MVACNICKDEVIVGHVVCSDCLAVLTDDKSLATKKNNFEKWKESLTIENCIDNFCYYNYHDCIKCPSALFCEATDPVQNNCAEIFKLWAESER